jgi:hypothetical protein
MRVIYLYGTLQREGVPCHLFCYMANDEYDEEKDIVKDEGSVDEHQSQPANKAVLIVLEVFPILLVSSVTSKMPTKLSFLTIFLLNSYCFLYTFIQSIKITSY